MESYIHASADDFLANVTDKDDLDQSSNLVVYEVLTSRINLVDPTLETHTGTDTHRHMRTHSVHTSVVSRQTTVPRVLF